MYMSLWCATWFAVLALPAFYAVAQEYPVRAIRLIVPYTPSGPTDILSRIVAQRFTETWGQPVIVENRPGAAGMIGTETAVRAAADGYTLCTAGLTFTTATALNPKLPFSPLRDFVPVALIGMVPNVLSLHPSVPAKSVRELIRVAKAQPGKLAYPTGGVGGGQWLAGALFDQLAGVKMLPVQYRGSAPGVTALISGEVSVGFTDLIISMPQAKSGRLRVLAVTSERRSDNAPELPTMHEAGVPGFGMTAWFGLVAPTGTPAAVIGKLNREVLRIMKLPDTRQRLTELGADAGMLTAEQFGTFLKVESDKWERVIRTAEKQN